MTPRDLPYTGILDLLIELERAETPERFSRVAMEGVVRLVPTDADVTTFVDDSLGPRFFAGMASRKMGGEFNDYYRRKIPIAAERFPAEYQTDYREWEGSEFVTDFIRPNHVWRSAVSAIRGFSVTLHRSRTSRPFDDREISTLSLLGRHLTVLYERLFRTAEIGVKAITDEELAAGRLTLTRREREVLALARVRLTSNEIARRLGISSRTVEKHFANMYERTGTGNRWELLRRHYSPQAPDLTT